MIDKALLSLRHGAEWSLNGESYDGLDWLDNQQTKPTEQEVLNEVERLKTIAPLEECKRIAKQLIAATDWAVLPDVGLANQDAFVFYRLNLRNLIKNPVANPVFEAEPTPIWS